jgi:hypothetical protein
MAAALIGALLAMLVLVNGFAALRRPLDQLVQYDPIGKRLVERRGEAFALRMYRIFGASLVLLGLVALYLAVRLLLSSV